MIAKIEHLQKKDILATIISSKILCE